MTNIKKIQAMGAGRMACFLSEISIYCAAKDCTSCPISGCRDIDDEGECDVLSIKKWLESEAH